MKRKIINLSKNYKLHLAFNKKGYVVSLPNSPTRPKSELKTYFGVNKLTIPHENGTGFVLLFCLWWFSISIIKIMRKDDRV